MVFASRVGTPIEPDNVGHSAIDVTMTIDAPHLSRRSGRP